MQNGSGDLFWADHTAHNAEEAYSLIQESINKPFLTQKQKRSNGRQTSYAKRPYHVGGQLLAVLPKKNKMGKITSSEISTDRYKLYGSPSLGL